MTECITSKCTRERDCCFITVQMHGKIDCKVIALRFEIGLSNPLGCASAQL